MIYLVNTSMLLPLLVGVKWWLWKNHLIPWVLYEPDVALQDHLLHYLLRPLTGLRHRTSFLYHLSVCAEEAHALEIVVDLFLGRIHIKQKLVPQSSHPTTRLQPSIPTH